MRRAALGITLFAAGCGGGAEREPAAPSEFWVGREAEYRSDARGPFTAVRADYLELGDALALYAYEDSVGTEPGGLAAVEVRWDDAWGFTIRPVEGRPPASLDGDPVDTAYQVGDGSGVRLDRYLFTFAPQPPDLGRVIVHDPRRLAAFHGFPVFPADERFVVRASVSAAEGDTVRLGTTRGLERRYVRAAYLDFELEGAQCRLTGFSAPDEEALFVPFTDATSGGESYGVGRYLRVDAPEGATTATIDFRRATNPWCAYSPFYNCVLPPEENRLAVAIRAGERTPEGH